MFGDGSFASGGAKLQSDLGSSSLGGGQIGDGCDKKREVRGAGEQPCERHYG
jgi:hypothetical protein